MKILFACHQRDLVGGAETYNLGLYRELTARGHDVTILSEHATRGPSKGDWFQSGWCLGGTGETGETGETGGRGGAGGTGAAQRFSVVQDVIDQWSPDVAFVGGVVNVDLERELATRYRTVAFAHAYAGLCATGAKTHSLPTTRICTRRLSVACLAFHYPRRCGGLSPVTAVRDFKRESLRLKVFERHYRIVVGSSHMLREFARHEALRTKVVHIPMPIAPAAGDREPQDKSAPLDTVAFVGRLTKQKGCGMLVRALQIASQRLGRPLKLEVLGTGSEEEYVRRLSLELGVEIRFHGHVESADRDTILSRTHLLAVPSLWPEPFGLVGLEAARVGTPAVAFDVGGIQDWLIPGETGELVTGPALTAARFADGIVTALADPAYYRLLRSGALANLRRFTPEAHYDRMEQVLAP